VDISKQEQPKNGESSGLWLLKIVAGLMIIFLLGLHFIANHLVAPNGLMSWAEVVAYYQNPIIPILEVVFLILVLGHAALGMRSITLDLNLPVRKQRTIDWVIAAFTFGFAVYGSWIVMKVVLLGM
jgi:succinate dehydrogenase hydrophobic anchor subunit